MEKVKIGSKLKELRSSSGITQKVIANHLNIRVNSYSQYENDIRQPDYDTLRKITEFYEVTMDYLFGFESGDDLVELRLMINNLTKEYKLIQKMISSYREDNEADLGTIFNNIETFNENKNKMMELLLIDQFEKEKKYLLK
ncbi:hypothetical protein CI105_08575 [Candidatus Izimaplasma bacterium ZiA1]|uniref:helix-turn-helix domain-containing protein n=1 Tax=Candidatus Izimoplasma sp. ZiA1 TaxID=2024899 RepID=UPI000BAA8927|nr:hypothetical protein CI105_08575 [Candidatus Izimaplasma bacterium ZiA1]